MIWHIQDQYPRQYPLSRQSSIGRFKKPKIKTQMSIIHIYTHIFFKLHIAFLLAFTIKKSVIK